MAEGTIPNLSQDVWIEELTDSVELKQFWKCLGGAKSGEFKNGFVRFQPSGQVLPRCYARLQKEINELEVREDDVWISSFPKCGTTWTQEMVWNIVHNLDFKTARAVTLDERVPFLELSALSEPDNLEGAEEVAGTFSMDSMDQVKNLKSPRVIKTHLSIDMLPEQVLQKKAKIIYVTRNPRDAVVSFYNHWRILENYTGTFEVFLSAFLADVCGYYTPFIQHVLGYWNKKNDVKMLFLTYEEMKADLPKVIKRVADFLAKSLTDEEVSTLADHLSFKNMSNNAAVNKEDVVEFAIKLHGGNSIQEAKSGGGKFMRKGEVGDWQNHLTEEQVSRMAAWENRQLHGSDFSFVYHL